MILLFLYFAFIRILNNCVIENNKLIYVKINFTELDNSGYVINLELNFLF